jgi:HK97 family phage portal protein
MSNAFTRLFSRKEDKEEIRAITPASLGVADWDSVEAYNTVDKLSIVYGAVKLLSETVASLPVKIYKKEDGVSAEYPDHPYYDLLNKSPNNWQTAFDFWAWVTRQLLLNGNAVIQRVKNGSGFDQEFIPIDASRVTIQLDSITGKPTYTIGGKVYKDTQIIHVKSYSVDGVVGMSAVQAFSMLFNSNKELDEAGIGIAKNAAKPSGVLKYPGNIRDEDLAKIKANWANGFTGRASGKTAFIPSTWTIENPQLGLSAADAQLIESKRFSAQRICSDIFRVPLHMLGLSTNPTYASVEAISQEFIQYTINPIVINIEAQINNQLLSDEPGVYAKFKTNALLRGDTQTRMAMYKFLIENGCATPNKIVALEDLGYTIPPEQGGDTYMRPLNYGVATNKPNQNQTV